MTILALIRHGETSWNREGRLQGRVDTPLSPRGIAELRGLQVPAELAGATWLTSPLARAAETARLLGSTARVEPLLIETAWGAFEGLQKTITNAHAERISARGQAGLDLRAPGGESPRDVQARLATLIATLEPQGGVFIGVTHRGVIRAMLSLATGWPMLEKPLVKMSWRAAHLFELGPGGRASLLRANAMLEPRAP